jgi:hypothetical protein
MPNARWSVFIWHPGTGRDICVRQNLTRARALEVAREEASARKLKATIREEGAPVQGFIIPLDAVRPACELLDAAARPGRGRP